MIHIFLCIHSFALIKDIMERISSLSSVDVVGLTTILPKLTSVFEEANIDVLFLDCTYAQEEAILLGRTIQQNQALNIKIIYLFHAIDEQIIQYVLNGEIKFYACQPFYGEQLVNLISDDIDCSLEPYIVHYNSKESSMVQVMQTLGLPVHLQGYTFLKSASTLVLNSPKEMHMSMKLLYKEVARMHTTTITRVEKSIRTAIDFAYRVAPKKIALQGKKPTNSQVIHYISEQVHLIEIERKEEVKG